MSATTQTVQNELDILQEAHRMQNETLFQPLVRGVKSLIGSIVADFRRAAMRRQLEALDDRMLRDIGLRRDDISSLVANAFASGAHEPGTQAIAAELYYLAPATPGPAAHRGDHRIAA
tara:strand:- start:721 stop:1074 length:354 start_codon:yes stop_codon:yes gene_type:complete